MYRVLFFLLIVFCASCKAPRNLVYFSDLNDSIPIEKFNISEIEKPKIKSGDILSINISSLNQESNNLFNSGVLIRPENNNANLGNRDQLAALGYLVDSNGEINFPVVGTLFLEGLTMEEARNKIQKTLSSYVKDPIVNMKFLNFRVTVIGEVNRPSTFTVDNERINVLEALGMAGDMTMYGKRENVLLIREERGVRTMIRLDLNNSQAFRSPYFNLKQNDIIYVAPDRMKERQASTNVRTIAFLASFTSVLIVAISRLL